MANTKDIQNIGKNKKKSKLQLTSHFTVTWMISSLGKNKDRMFSLATST